MIGKACVKSGRGAEMNERLELESREGAPNDRKWVVAASAI